MVGSPGGKLMRMYKLISSRYLSELNELQECLRIIDIAVAACPEPNSLLYAHLCNCAQVCTFQLPNLPLCHRWTEVGDRIRHRLLPPDSWERTNCDHNDGNLATAEGRLDEALVLYKKAEHTRLQAGTSAAMAIVLSHLCIGRVLFYQGMYADAMARYDKAEALIVPLHGLNGPFMAE
jgi:tetratricopeptide (TPR) repeat protein